MITILTNYVNFLTLLKTFQIEKTQTMTQILKLFSDRRGGTFSGMAPRTRTLRAGLFKP